MPHIEWNDDLGVGIKEIDEQHFNLVRIINAVDELENKGQLDRNAGKATYTLLTFAKFHFRTEQELMEKHGYPGIDEHKKSHSELLDEISRIHEMVERGEQVDFYPVYNFLNKWFNGHTKEHDIKYVGFFVKKGVAKEIKKKSPAANVKGAKLTLGKHFLIEWTDSHNIGIDDIDRQHQNLAHAINLLYSTLDQPANKLMKERVDNAFKELATYTGQHFSREEGLMESCRYPDLIVHRMEHDEFKRKITAAKKKFEKYKTLVDHDLVVMLRDWFMDHTQEKDRGYICHLKNKEDVSVCPVEGYSDQ